jgi:hypothetical protein
VPPNERKESHLSRLGLTSPAIVVRPSCCRGRHAPVLFTVPKKDSRVISAQSFLWKIPQRCLSG